MTIDQFEKLQQDITKIQRLKQNMRNCYQGMLEARELRKAIGSVNSGKRPWLKEQEQFWKRAYWKAAAVYKRASASQLSLLEETKNEARG